MLKKFNFFEINFCNISKYSNKNSFKNIKGANNLTKKWKNFESHTYYDKETNLYVT